VAEASAEPMIDLDELEVRMGDIAVRVPHPVELDDHRTAPVALPLPVPTIAPPATLAPLPRRPLQAAVKRLMDLVGSLTLLLVLSPLLLAVAIAIRLDSPGPILFRQHRLGRGGHLFPLYKFRSMVRDGEAALAHHLATHEGLREEWERSRKLRDDPRITRIGGFLRRHSVDELPQLLNVVRGEMSLVGPRPVAPDELLQMGALGPQIVEVRPGLTGLWAVSGRSDTTYLERAELEHRYARDWSLLMDLRILVRTIPAVVFGRGAY
jgi:lipopolysaccharide/colanic/teichoic acid biosynthesis glycosyltransferase